MNVMWIDQMIDLYGLFCWFVQRWERLQWIVMTPMGKKIRSKYGDFVITVG